MTYVLSHRSITHGVIVALGAGLLVAIVWPSPDPVPDAAPVVVERAPEPTKVEPPKPTLTTRELEQLLQTKDDTVRRKVIGDLGARPSPESVALLSQQLERERNGLMRGHAAIQLKRASVRHAPGQVARRLVALFATTKNPVVRGCVLSAFAIHGVPGDAPHLDELARTTGLSPHEVRTIAQIRKRYP